MDKDFQSFARSLKNEKLFQTEDYFHANQALCIEKFKLNFITICKEIVKLQNSGELPEVAYLEYTLRYTNFMKRDYMAEIRVYGEDWYLDKHQSVIGTFDVSFLFGGFTGLWDQLLSARKGYVGKVSSAEIAEAMVSALPNFYSYVVLIGRFGILSCIGDENYQAIKRLAEFEINIGEYMGHTEAIYKENGNKDRDTFVDWFKQRLEFEYAFEDLTGMDFSGEDLSEVDFRYSDLRGSILKGADFQDSMLFGTRFCNADMEGADLRYSLLYEADFTGAILRDAKFVSAKANAGIQDTEWQIAGYMGVSFRGADLSHADFTRSSFLGADFTGAKMDGAVFNKGHVGQLALTQEQRNVIIVR